MTTHPSMPQRLYLMQVVTWFSPEATWPIPYPCYLIHMSDGRHILIDTGWPEELPSRPGLQAGKNVVEQLALLDLQPADIAMLICTHFDLDHAGRHSAFTKAELIVQRQHYELARSGYPRLAPARPMWDHPCWPVHNGAAAQRIRSWFSPSTINWPVVRILARLRP